MKKLLSVIVCGSLLLLTACKNGAQASDEIRASVYGADEIQYEIAQAQLMDLSETRSIGASVGYPYAVYLTYPDEALVMEYNVYTGAEVREGDILAQLDSSALNYEINNQQTLVNAAAASGSQLDYELESSKLEMLQAEKESYTIRAPFNGIITYTKRISEGNYTEKGAVCCAISEKNRAMVYIEGSEAAQFRFGQKVEVKLDGTTYGATVVQAPDSTPSDVTENRALFVLDDNAMEQIAEENPMAISAGWATVYVTSEKKNVLAVPDAAIKKTTTKTYVTLVDGEEHYKLNVTVGESIGGYTEIINGISEGDTVVAQGSGVLSSAADSESDKRDERDNNEERGAPPDF